MNKPPKPTRRYVPPGFTLVELMVVLTIIGIMATMCLPNFQKAIQQSRIDIAAANLRAIWAAERLYWLEYHAYTPGPASEDHLDTLNHLKLLDSEVLSTSGGFTYAVPSTSPFSATALYQSGSYSLTLTIDENGEITSTGTTPGFQ
jgi:prepilin-type N-terminal cleavage/methylation domain-containing protein